jgi:hypothetical protein
VTKSLRWFRHPTPPFIGCSLNRPICVIQSTSGNTARSFGVQQLAAAFLPFTQLPVAHRRIRSLWNQSLTNCKLFNSFVLTFMHVMGVVGSFRNSTSQFPIPHPLFPFFSYPCALFCTLLQVAKIQLPCFQRFPHSSSKNRGWGVPLRKTSNGFWLPQERVLLNLWPVVFCRMSNLSAVI